MTTKTKHLNTLVARGGQYGLVFTLKKVPSKSFLSKRLSQDRGNVFKQIIILMVMVMMMSMTMMTMTIITMITMMMMMEKEGSDLIQMRQDLRCRNYSFGRNFLIKEIFWDYLRLLCLAPPPFERPTLMMMMMMALLAMIAVCQISDDNCQYRT